MNKEKIHYFMTMFSICGLVGASVGIGSGTAGLFYKSVSADLGLSSSTVSLTYTISAVTAAFAALLTPKILKKEKNLKLQIIAGVALLAGGTFLLSTAGSVPTLYLYNVMRGAGIGLLNFVLATTVLNQWFLARNGLMVSIAMAFSGIPNVLLASLFSSVIVKSGWRFGYVFVSLVILVFCLPGLLYPIKLKPAMLGMKAYGYDDYMKYRKENYRTAVVRQTGNPLVQHLPELVSLMLFAVMVCIAASMLQHLPSYAASLGMAAGIGALMTSCASAANITSKLLYGALSDKIGAFRSTVLCAGVNICSVLIMLMINVPAAMVLAAFMYGFTFANSSAAMSSMTRDIFGMENFTRVYPMISFTGSMANAFGVTLLGALYDATGSYRFNLMMCLLMQTGVILLTGFLASRSGKKEA